MAATTSSTLMVHLAALVVVVVVVLAVCFPAASAAPVGRRYRVGGPEGWRVPPPEDKEMYYVKWSSPITFFVEDSIEFVYKNDTVIKVSKAGYYHCNETAGVVGTGAVPRDGSTLFLLDTPGIAYFASADLDHCNKGERLIINVLTAEPPAPSSFSSAQAPATTAPRSQPPSLAPAPAPSMEYASAAVGLSSVASFTHAVVSAATLALGGLI